LHIYNKTGDCKMTPTTSPTPTGRAGAAWRWRCCVDDRNVKCTAETIHLYICKTALPPPKSWPKTCVRNSCPSIRLDIRCWGQVSSLPFPGNYKKKWERQKQNLVFSGAGIKRFGPKSRETTEQIRNDIAFFLSHRNDPLAGLTLPTRIPLCSAKWRPTREATHSRQKRHQRRVPKTNQNPPQSKQNTQNRGGKGGPQQTKRPNNTNKHTQNTNNSTHPGETKSDPGARRDSGSDTNLLPRWGTGPGPAPTSVQA
jgi:hypothetical protein